MFRLLSYYRFYPSNVQILDKNDILVSYLLQTVVGLIVDTWFYLVIKTVTETNMHSGFVLINNLTSWLTHRSAFTLYLNVL